MFYNFLFPLANEFSLFQLFKYLTFRTGGAIVTSLLLCFYVGPKLIRYLRYKQTDGQPIRDDGPESHFQKKGTPTMGGLMILFSTMVSSLLWIDLTNLYFWVVALVTMGFGFIGFMDDYLKLTKKNAKGLSGKKKLFYQILISAVAVSLTVFATEEPLSMELAFPFVKDLLLNLGYFYFPFAVLVIIGSSNAVNLTDGLDGLAVVPVIISVACFGLISYLVGNLIFADYLHLHHVPGTGELAVFCGALIGAGLGFLWFNAPPASIFMGDTGSLALGGALGTMSVITKHEIVLAIIGGLFVLETVSVMVQVASFQLTGRRVFKMAPLHHHFEKKGWSEPTIVIRFWIVSVILALIGLSTLKLR
ncbi:MAG: phospho-N-acetylmuramoyl-pentapeptide-transferase [Alphaproteobacteria bacterium]|jgi:phospho-N-acetylmuramoyl-pentapeptide-transferase|nr:phospho-N-acetylmuramoyl-pentapeptide-transferase [Alphaproteobacteria bacterium]MBP9877149.1 phospho-N-acetylmuramoyl-pentapeptide-transferase [Alphaproteobacteria bacterium]